MELQLPPDLEIQLDQLAATGTDVTAFVAQSIREGFERQKQDEPVISEAEWQAGFQQWADSFPVRKNEVDDSRESIYDRRDE